MFSRKEMEIILKKFYLSCNLPVSAFEYDGTLISNNGYDISSKFDEHEIFESLINELKPKCIATISINQALFSACPISLENIHEGIFVIGPYTDNLNNNMFTYKDTRIIDQLISLIYIISQDTASKNTNGDSYSFHVNKAIEYIKSRYKDSINLDEVANYLNINKCYLCSLIKKETGKTFTYLLNNIRIEKSKDLLKNNKSTILDVALAVGYNNQSYYNTMFKKITNSTPMAYRNSRAC